MFDLKPEAREFLQRLKTETSEAHSRLEQNDLSKKIMSSHLTVNNYAAYLGKMLSLHQAVEERLFPKLSPYFPDLEERKKAHLIQKDLDALNTASLADFNADMSFVNTEGGALGLLYVIEGSALGGKVILKQLQKTLPGEVYNSSTNYFSVYGDKMGSMWMSFLKSFSDRVLSQNMEPEVIKGAAESFALVQRWFEK